MSSGSWTRRRPRDACAAGDPGLEKEAWVSRTLLEWGSCGKLLYVDGAPAGYVMYAPPGYVPRGGAFPTSPASPDAALLTTAARGAGVRRRWAGTDAHPGRGAGPHQAGLRAIEVFGDAKYGEPDPAVETAGGAWRRPTSSSR